VDEGYEQRLVGYDTTKCHTYNKCYIWPNSYKMLQNSI